MAKNYTRVIEDYLVAKNNKNVDWKSTPSGMDYQFEF